MKTVQNSIEAFERASRIFLDVIKVFNPFDEDLAKEGVYETQLIRFTELWAELIFVKKHILWEDCRNCVLWSFYPWKSTEDMVFQEYLPHIVQAVWVEWSSV